MSRPVGKLCGTLLLGSSLALAQQYSITTAAGGAPPPTPVSAVSTSIGQPSRVTVDSKNNIYFSSSNAVFKIDTSGNLTVVAGNSRAGYSGDGGPALQAQLNSPQGLAVDSAGDIYICDSKNNRVRMVNAAGIISTFAGTGFTSPGGANTFNDGGLAINALMRLPSGVFVDSSGNVYIADTGDNIIRKVTTNGIINTIVGDSYGAFLGDTLPAINAELHAPTDVWVDSSGNIFIADSANAAIREVTASTGIISTVAGNASVGDTGDTGPATSAALITPYAVVVDSKGNIYFAENGDSKIREVTVSTGIITSIVGIGTAGFGGDGSPATKAQLNFPTGVALDSSGNIYIADALNRRIRKVAGTTIATIAGNGVLSYAGDGGPPTAAQLNTPQAVALDSSGNYYIADTFNNVIRKVTPAGVISTIAGNGTAGSGGDGGAATSAQFNGPQGIAVDSSGNIYVSDTQNARVRKISGGSISTVAGNGTAGYGGDGAAATSAELNVPIGLALDAANNLYIADTGNNLIRKVSGGIVSTIAGNGLPGAAGDGGPALSAAVGNPNGLAVDTLGNLYIADGSARVRKVYPTGFITTIAGNGARGYSGDGGSAPFGMLSAPVALAVASNGNVYVADSANNAIRLLTFGGYELSIGAAVNAASNQVGPVSGGEVVVFYGSMMGPAGLVQNQPGANGQYSTSLAGTTVYFGNYQAPILYTSATQVAVVVPFEVSGSTVLAFIQDQGQYSSSFPVSIAQSSPGIFTADLSGEGLAAAVNIQNGAYSYNTAAHPANAGDFVEIYLTGTGPTNPAGVDGQPYTVLAGCALPVAVTIGGQSVTPQYCGGVPGVIPGLTQINLQIPTGLTAGLVPVTVKFGGVSAQSGVTIAVSGH